MCGPQRDRFEHPFYMHRSINDSVLSSIFSSGDKDRNPDSEYIHSIEWAYKMMREGRKVRRKSWPKEQYAFLYRKNGSLYGNSLIIDQAELSNLILERFATIVLRADKDDETCMALGDPGDINLQDWAAA